MRYIYMTGLVIVLSQITCYFTASGQSPLSLNNDSLHSSLKVFLENMKSNKAYKEIHFLKTDEFDYFNSINSSDFAQDLIKVLTKIELSFELKEIAEITFVKLYDWTETNSTWFITLIDNLGNHQIYHYEDNTDMKKAFLIGVEKTDFFYRLAKNLYQVRSCQEMNEDYVVIGSIVGNKFTSYFSSQSYHQMDIVFFNDLQKALSN